MYGICGAVFCHMTISSNWARGSHGGAGNERKNNRKRKNNFDRDFALFCTHWHNKIYWFVPVFLFLFWSLAIFSLSFDVYIFILFFIRFLDFIALRTFSKKNEKQVLKNASHNRCAACGRFKTKTKFLGFSLSVFRTLRADPMQAENVWVRYK